MTIYVVEPTNRITAEVESIINIPTAKTKKERKKLTSKPRNRSQQKRHIPIHSLIRTAIRRFLIRRRDRSSQQTITQHPRKKNAIQKKKEPSAPRKKKKTKKKKHPLGPKTPIIILLLRALIRFTLHLGRLGIQHVDRILIQRVDILFVRRDFRFHFARLTGRGDGAQVFGDGVVAFRAPGDVVHVCELGWEGKGVRETSARFKSVRLTA